MVACLHMCYMQQQTSLQADAAPNYIVCRSENEYKLAFKRAYVHCVTVIIITLNNLQRCKSLDSPRAVILHVNLQLHYTDTLLHIQIFLIFFSTKRTDSPTLVIAKCFLTHAFNFVECCSLSTVNTSFAISASSCEINDFSRNFGSKLLRYSSTMASNFSMLINSNEFTDIFMMNKKVCK